MLTPRSRGSVADSFASIGEERGALAQEELELVVVDPVPGVGDFDQAAIGYCLIAGVIFGNGQKTFQAPEKEYGIGDLAEKLDGVFHVVTVRGNGAGVVVEFPEQGTVGLPIGAVQRQMACDLVRETR